MRLKPALSLVLFSVLSGSLAVAQQPDGGSPPPPSARMPGPRSLDRDGGGGRSEGMRPDFRIAPPGMWWKNPDLVQKLTLTADQQKRMDDIFQQSRLKLIDQHAAVEKEDAILEPLLSAEQPDETRVLAQIDKVAQARAELEKANARMLLGLRGALTTAQWKTLQTLGPEERMGRRGPDDRRGRHGPDRPPAGNGGPAAPGNAPAPGAPGDSQ